MDDDEPQPSLPDKVILTSAVLLELLDTLAIMGADKHDLIGPLVSQLTEELRLQASHQSQSITA